MADGSSLGGCQPLAPPRGGGVYEPIRAMVHELGPGGLSPEDYRAEIVPLVKQFAVGDTSGSQTFRAPATHNFVIEQIMGVCALVDFANETLNLSTEKVGDFSSNPNIPARVLMKAMNCRVTLQNTDRSVNVIDGGLGSLNLSAILPMVGGRVIDYSSKPHILPAGETLSMTATLIQNVANIRGGATEYGLLLVGTLVRVKAS